MYLRDGSTQTMLRADIQQPSANKRMILLSMELLIDISLFVLLPVINRNVNLLACARIPTQCTLIPASLQHGDALFQYFSGMLDFFFNVFSPFLFLY